ncbi:MXAN_6640 family putative metalloprotease [Nocardioides sp.]|uniref:MXAN_6640 family putative metalloprotease n=1 Tax=Nocardioides sp. TaxID=35761 RepID=UPI0026066684|nr:MXAN_6640 family putative metalloprotease [Nocardioides sp.]MCW2737786.1 hypothetical protein [Nocardioides sp.]
MRTRTTAGLLASVLALTLGPALALPASAGAAGKPGRAAQAVAAQAALAAVEAAVVGETDDARHRDLTLAMRDLFVAKHALRGDDRADAERLLLRPTTPPDDPTDPRDIYYGEDADLQTQCGETFCLHWVEEGEHASTAAFAAAAFETIAHVAGVYAAAGFRAPLPDEGQEGDTRTDFYLGDLDQYGALGFCRSDADGPVVGSAWYGYCGFDNDYANSPWLDPTSLLQVTVAHEYFHAVQFAYDAEDDGWLMESTATAMEDELYDDVNDNAFFLNYGQMGDPDTLGYPLAGPSTPLDTFDFTAYGNWGFWRYLTEQHDDETAGVPNLVREVWEALDTTQGSNPAFSLTALDSVLAARGTSTPQQSVAFAAANQHPAGVYEEAVEQFYPTAPNTLDTVQLSRQMPSAARTAVLDHLTSATGAVLPFAGSRELKVRVDLRATDVAQAAVTVHRVDGTSTTSYVSVNRQGKGSVTVPFAADDVTSVEVTVANGSTTMVECGSFSIYACGGVSPDDGLVAEIRFQAVR